jgi:WD40 repeat protein
MAPEQAEGKGVGPATDVYALGAVLYGLVTGRPPFQGPTPLETLVQLRQNPPVPPRHLQPRLPRDLDTICLKCLEKEPHRRYTSAQELADDLHRFLSREPIRARPVGALERAAKWVRRRPAVAGLLAAVVLLTAVGFAAVAWQWRAEKAARQEAERLAASVTLDQAIGLCERGEPAGQLALVGALEDAVRIADADLERVARANLAAWQSAAADLRRRFQLDRPARGYSLAVALSPDGKTLLTANADDWAILWDMASGRQTGVLRPKDYIWAVAWSPDGKTLLTGTGRERGDVQRWDAARRRPVGDPLAHVGPIRTLAFRPPDGRAFLSAAGKTVCLYSSRTGKRLCPSLEHPAEVLCAAFRPDGRVVVTGDAAAVVRFWNADTGKPRGKPLANAGPVWAVAYSPNGRVLTTGSGPPNQGRFTGPWGQVRLWIDDSPQLLRLPLNHPSPVRAVAFGWGGRLLITGAEDSRVRFFYLQTGEAVAPFAWVEGMVSCLVPADAGRSVLLGTATDRGSAWRLTLPRPPELLQLRPPDREPGREIWTITFSGDSRLVAVGGGIRRGVVWDLAGPRPLQVSFRQEGEPGVWAIALRPDGKAVLTGEGDKTCLLWDLPGGRLRWKSRQAGGVVSLAFRPDGKYFASGCLDGTARVWETATGALAGPPLRHGDSVEVLAFSQDGTTLYSAGKDGRVKHWDPYQGSLRWEVADSGPIMSGGLSGDGRLVATVMPGRPVRLWDARTGQPIDSPLSARAGALHAVALAPNGRWLATASTQHTVRVWDVVTGKPISRPMQHPSQLYRLQFSPDGRRLATTCQDGYLRLWQIDVSMEGSLEQIRLGVERLSERTLGPHGEVLELDDKALEERCQRLQQLAK